MLNEVHKTNKRGNMNKIEESESGDSTNWTFERIYPLDGNLYLKLLKQFSVSKTFFLN